MDAIAAARLAKTASTRVSSIAARAAQHVAFPLGGIGSGSVSLTGSGRLIDWSIHNRPAIHQHNGYSHFAIKAERGRHAPRCARAERPLRGARRPARRAAGSSTASASAPMRRFAGRRAAFRRRDFHRALPDRRARFPSTTASPARFG